MTVIPFDPKTEVEQLEARIAQLESELHQAYAIGEAEFARLRGSVLSAFHKLGFNFKEAVQRTEDVFRK